MFFWTFYVFGFCFRMLAVILVSDFCKERLPPQFDSKLLACLSKNWEFFWLAWVHNVRPLCNSSLQEWMLCSPCLVMVDSPFNNSHFVKFDHREYVLDFGVFMIFENLVNFSQLDLLSAFFLSVSANSSASVFPGCVIHVFAVIYKSAWPSLISFYCHWLPF